MEMVWDTPIYRFRVSLREESEFLDEVILDVTGSAPSFTNVRATMKEVWDTFLESNEGKNVQAVLDFGAAKFRNTLYFLRKGKRVAAVEFEDIPKNSTDAKTILKRCKATGNFQELILPHPFIEDPSKFDLVLLVNVLPVMPVFAERLLVLDLLYDKVNENKYVLWYAQKEGSYKTIREAGKNDFGDGLWMGVNKKFKTFYRYHSIDETTEMFALYGFQRVKKIPAGPNDVILFQKSPHNLLRGIVTSAKISESIAVDPTIEDPVEVKFKRVKATDQVLEIGPNPPTLSLEKLYAVALNGIPPGIDGAEKYHRLVSQIILRTFRNSLSNMDIKVDLSGGLKVIDTVYTNSGGFFTHFAETTGLKCPYIPLEAKNYSFDVGNPEFDQIGGRLNDDVGKLGLLVCRKIDNADLVKRRSQAALNDGDKHVVVLTDSDVLSLLSLRADSDDEGINQFMDSKIRALRFRSRT